MDVLQKMAIPCSELSREQLESVAHTALASKVAKAMSEKLTTVCCDAVEAIRQPGVELDLHMVEVMEMKHKTDLDTQLVSLLYHILYFCSLYSTIKIIIIIVYHMVWCAETLFKFFINVCWIIITNILLLLVSLLRSS